MFGLFKKIRNKSIASKKIAYDSWNECNIFSELIDKKSELNNQVTFEYNTLSDTDIQTIKDLGFNNTACEFDFSTIKKLKIVIDNGGILVRLKDIKNICKNYKMSFEPVSNFNGKLTSQNIKELVSLKSIIDKWSGEFKYFSKDTYNAPPNAKWQEIRAENYKLYVSIKAYKKEPILYILEKENSDKVIFVSILKDQIYVPISFIKSERKNKIDEVLNEG